MIPIAKRLSPCVTLKAVCTDKFKTERVSVLLNTTSDERLTPVEKFAFSVLKCGCTKYPDKKLINIRLDELYSSAVFPMFSFDGENVSIGFGAEMLGNEFASADVDVFEGTLELIFNMLFEPVLNEKQMFLSKFVERERENICDTIRSVVNSPRAYASKRLIEIMYEGDKFSMPTSGTVELVQSITEEELINAYRTLVQNSSYEVFYVGAKRLDEVEETVKKYFNKYKFGKERTDTVKISFNADTVKTKYVEEDISISQSILMLGFKTGINIICDRDFYAIKFFNEIFGGSPISKLFMNVRERLGLCYYCGSKYDSCKGMLYVSCGIEKDCRQKAEKEILRQFENIRQGKISKEEFDAAKKSLINAYSETTDSASAIERFYCIRDAYGVIDSIEDAKHKVSDVTIDDVVRVANGIKLDTVYFLCGKECGDDED